MQQQQQQQQQQQNMRTRSRKRSRKRKAVKKRGGSGLGFRISSNIVQKLKSTQKSNSKRGLPTKRKNIHPNLTNADLENLHVVNTSTDEWRIQPGSSNKDKLIPKNLLPQSLQRQTFQITEAGPGVRVFTKKARRQC